MRELESSLQQFAEFLLKAQLVRPSAAPFVVRAVRQFHRQAATDESLADRVRRFYEDLERAGRQDWQVQQAEQGRRLYFVNFLNRTDWHRSALWFLAREVLALEVDGLSQATRAKRFFVRSGKGDKDRSTLLPEAGRLG